MSSAGCGCRLCSLLAKQKSLSKSAISSRAMPKYRHVGLNWARANQRALLAAWLSGVSGGSQWEDRERPPAPCRHLLAGVEVGSCFERDLSILHKVFIAYLLHSKAFVCSVRQLPVTAILKGFIAVKYQSHQDTFLLSARSAAKSQYEWEINWQYSPQLMLTTPWCLLTGTNVIITSAQTYSRSTNYQLVNNDFKSIWAIEM